MQAFEFKTEIKDGIIVIPEKYKNKLNKNVKVIVLSEDKTEPDSDIIEELIKNPLKIKGFKPFKREENYDRG